jgi:hypothetical protein
MPLSRVTDWLAGLIIVLAGVSRAASPDTAISASLAPLFIGEERIVEGTVTAAERDGNVVRLRFGNTPQALTVALVVGLLSDFPAAPERYYLGHMVRVAGTIRSFKDRPEMVVHDPANIRIVGAAAPPAHERAAPAPPSGDDAPALREQVKTLTERVRTLEDQVQKLKGSEAPGTP